MVKKLTGHRHADHTVATDGVVRVSFAGMAENRYVSDQVKVFMDCCQGDSSYQDQNTEQQSMIVISSNCLIESQLTEIAIKGNQNFRFTDDLVTLLVEGLSQSKISLITLSLTHHRINDVGFIQLCRLILVILLPFKGDDPH
jgi:hypothetical protein